MSIVGGTRLGRYEIRSLLGAGGMGEVYLAQDTTLERMVALKILPANVAADENRMQRFMREAKTASALNHPNILTIHEIGQHDEHQFIATEFIEGESLRQHMSRTRMELREVNALLESLCNKINTLMSDHSVLTKFFHPSVRPTLHFVMRVASWRGCLALCTLACLLSLPVFAQQADPAPRTRGEKDAPVVVQPGAPGQPTRTLPSSTRATLPPPSPADVHFMQGMIMHHAQAVEMTALIESCTENREIRTLGERISRSQSDEMKFMKRWLGARGQRTSVAISHGSHGPQMHGMDMPGHNELMPGMLTPKQMEALRKAKGKEFDRLFLSGMIQHHNGALVMVKELFDTAGAGQDAELFNFASDVDSGQRAEIRVMEKILATDERR